MSKPGHGDAEMDEFTCPECGAMFKSFNVDGVECPCCCAIFIPNEETSLEGKP